MTSGYFLTKTKKTEYARTFPLKNVLCLIVVNIPSDKEMEAARTMPTNKKEREIERSK